MNLEIRRSVKIYRIYLEEIFTRSNGWKGEILSLCEEIKEKTTQ